MNDHINHKINIWLNAKLLAPTLFFGLCLTFLLSSCSSKTQNKGSSSAADSSVVIRPVVIFAKTDNKPIYKYIDAQGIVHPTNHITIQTKISGYITKDYLTDGEWVQKGDTLLTLNATEWKLNVEQAENNLQLKLADYNIQKNARIGTSYNDTMLQNERGVSQARINLQEAELNLSYTCVRAPFSGYLYVPQNYYPGQYINAGTPLGDLIDISKVIVRFEVLENDFQSLKIGQRVELTNPADSGMVGKIINLSPTVNPQTQTGQVIALFNNPNHKLLNGSTVSGQIVIATYHGKVRVPRAALLFRENRYLVFKLEGDEVYWIFVKPVAMNNKWAILNNPNVRPGDTVAVNRHFTLSHEQKVKVEMAD